MEKIIKLDDISYKYHPNEEVEALKNVSLSIEKGEWVAIIGHNGSGKSTLAKTINGLLAPTHGTVTVGNQLLTEETVWDVRRMVGMVFQNPDNQFVGSTVQDDVAFGLENSGVPRDEMVKRVTDAIDKVKMSDFIEKEPARLSGGQKQRVAIAGVVALRPDIIILDEATSMLDPQGRQEVSATVKAIKEEENLTVISITHDIDEAASANRILVMKNGQLIREGTPQEIFSFGDELIEMGLDLPFPEKLKSALKKRNIDVPKDYLTEEGMVDWLWTLLSKK
ncbi:energy-coupling factor ABC transporter ATP-binding protein [Carnobacterium maltaromaticum]|uniref:energy-coupling factor ABC transporter ATP-binding protein n=1 Tax=Carnobacterium maltaromaticum TaxID=2751 RepID=UPI000C776CF6|nr:energy-coupling factor ABC transporter ATP-binding protein [Carnobacterium maltaromaticum]PLS32713.1 energy-coupling factor ABC transporter ATP-binding protein [Carnobacterium maltaromaticum]PLS33213.1 energy-coupling factor ABC transporter ATP-binding protein [Carnobacterium maltaromaticum]PLS33299.1 energy-coupling factor ABC transporter ATP-binding protein [Carnobacterium maltaromaticum]PLS41019.1 energy-coupling factor ABC transporter ATP-binding protein [Carnobacterium maltaromaticum]P